MPLDSSILSRLQPPPPIDVLGPYKEALGLQTAQLQQQDIQSQIQQRQAIAQKDLMAQQKQQRLSQILSQAKVDPTTGAPDPASPEMQQLFREFPEVHAALSEHYAKVSSEKATAENQRGDLAVKQGTLEETRKRNLFEQQKEQTAQSEKQAQEAAGTLIPGTEFTTPDASGKPARAAQFKVRQPDGTYQNVTRTLGLEAAAPQNPPQPQAPMSAERFQQELALEKQKAALSGANQVPPLDFLKETSSTGVPFIDASKVEPKTLNALQVAAGQAGTKVVDKDTAQGLRDVKTAKANNQSMLDLLNGRLAETPLSRLFVAPENKLKQLGQIDPNLAVTGTFVGPAIQSLRAVAGAKGFRITNVEVENAIKNFVPTATDTVDVAKAKMTALAHFMDNKEQSVLGITPSSGNASPQATHRFNPATGKIEAIQ